MDPSPVIDVEALADQLADVTVLDVRYRLAGPAGPGEYAAGHVPGAVYVDLDTALAAPPGLGGRHPLPDSDVFCEAMRRAGVRQDRPVVTYDDFGGLAAARAWWLLRHYGHRSVAVLDGGWPAWGASGHRVETGPPAEIESGDFSGAPGAMPVVDVDAVTQVGVLMDVRAPERFRGEVEPIDPVAGHIPGAVNVPTGQTLDEHGLLRRPEELAALFGSVGAVPGTDVATYCGSGVTAAHAVLALELAGVSAALYPGSWSEWITDPQRQVSRSSRRRT
ncbi:MAG: sulfurtransferase [Nocardioides sp.]|uniref:sulfurtransferase n=1 Tax=Nocardioides sp. TaxID=35761 RepID=UPI0039E2A98B